MESYVRYSDIKSFIDSWDLELQDEYVYGDKQAAGLGMVMLNEIKNMYVLSIKEVMEDAEDY